ncbi:MAG: AmmeMemoRadiSam system radical SAM enzyme [Sedimentisphaeraceae bacterium JB056]
MIDRKEAYLWQKAGNNEVDCELCNFNCHIAPEGIGRCRVRKNHDGTLYSLNYNMLCAAAVDPIEKKPLYHFMPGTKSYSIAAPGCNFRCVFCQNWQISQIDCEELGRCAKTSSENIVKTAIKSGCSSISYTYSEPTIFMETAADAATEAKKAGLKNIFVSNGYMSKKAIDFAADWLDAINIDLKAFSQKFYKEMTDSNLEPVLNTLRYITHNTDIHLEITTLVIPDSNDSTKELNALTKFIADELSPQIPWHVSAFYPAHHCNKNSTDPKLVYKACDIGKANGLKYVYTGNIGASNQTACPSCSKTLIKRSGYSSEVFLTKPECPNCKTPIPIVL